MVMTMVPAVMSTLLALGSIRGTNVFTVLTPTRQLAESHRTARRRSTLEIPHSLTQRQSSHLTVLIRREQPTAKTHRQ
jgi:hypothetical protein